MRPTYFLTADGRTVDEAEALLNGMLRSGYGVRSHALMWDSAAPDGVAQAVYEARISDAWKHGLAGPSDQALRVAPLPSRLTNDANGQAAYEHWIANAWKGQQHV